MKWPRSIPLPKILIVAIIASVVFGWPTRLGIYRSPRYERRRFQVRQRRGVTLHDSRESCAAIAAAATGQGALSQREDVVR
jgi:hypothetical protein